MSVALAFIASCAPWPSQPKDPDTARVPRRWTPEFLSTEGYESSPTFTPDGQEMYFVRADRQFRNYRILRSRCENGAWSAPERPSFAKDLPVLDADPHATRDGRRLYFISTRHNPAHEDFDIWYVERQPGGDWGTARRLPEPVNSPGSELLPRLAGDGTLVFGSARPGGHGESDIYAARQDPQGRWSVANIGPPVSTPFTDYEAEVSVDGRRMIVVSDRGDKSHLYRFEKGSSGWVETGRMPGAPDVFQVGPLLSPAGDRLLFAQAEPGRSGEIFLVDLEPGADRSWPPCAGAPAGPAVP